KSQIEAGVLYRSSCVPTCRAIAWLFFGFKKITAPFLSKDRKGVLPLFFQNLKTLSAQNSY
ncbi:MAG: hypothetical protein Q7U40_08535, partial [Desulfatirhabdiaceae bacterium]|nr:hypothetical protein [Desulfatirhabdiaceae bacterium]